MDTKRVPCQPPQAITLVTGPTFLGQVLGPTVASPQGPRGEAWGQG